MRPMTSNYVCPNCGMLTMSPFYQVSNVPVHTCLMISTQQEALDFPKNDIALGFCENCGFISNILFKSSMLDYSSVYEDQQCFSSTFNVFAENLAKRLAEKYNLRKKKIIEIGCGKGDFLTLLCELGDNYGLGIDPAYVKGRTFSKVSKRIKFIRDYWSERYAKYNGDFVCCRHTLEHISKTKAFLNSVRHAIGNNLNSIIFFEVPDVTRVLRELAFWDIYYEHCSYFTPGSLARLFRSCKFEILDLYRDFDDQYLLIEARPVTKLSRETHKLEESIEKTASDVKFFSKNYFERLNQWKNRLRQFKADGKRVVVWGSGSKCVSFLTTLSIKDEIEYVIDINPYRHGKYLPGAGKIVMPPEFLKKYTPDITIVMNSIYCDEIKKMLEDMGLVTEVITV